MGLVLGAGFFGLWFLSGNETKIINTDNVVNQESQNNISDQFSDVGGKTPQETLNLFIKTLEKNDLISAIKYFIPENREIESEDLEKLYKANILGDLIKELKNIKNGKMINNGHYIFEVSDSSDPSAQAILEIEMIKNKNGFWKIVSI